MPTSPCTAGTNTIAASPEKISPSALTMSTLMVRAMAGPSGDRLGLLDRFLDRADHVKGLLREIVVLARNDRLEAADRVLDRHVLALLAGEHLGDVERLRQEALDLARAVHEQLVLGRQFVHAEDRDDVLQFLAARQAPRPAKAH